MPRALNDVATPLQVLTALASIMPANTQFALGPGSFYLNSLAAISNGTAGYPCVVLHEGPQDVTKIAWRTWQTKLTVLADYYDEWHQQPNVIDTIWANIDLDLRRMKANIEDNPTLTLSGVRYAIRVDRVQLSPYFGEVLSKLDSPAPIPLVRRSATMQITVPPYLAAR